MTENEAKQYVKEIFDREVLFVMLSIAKANMVNGKSIPYVGRMENDEKTLFVFTSFERAKNYMDECGYEVLGGNYAVGRIEKTDKYRCLHTLFSIALTMGIGHVQFDLHSEEAFGCPISWFFEVNGLKREPVSILMSEEEMKAVMSNQAQVPLRMNPVEIYNYSNPYKLSEERASEVIHHIFTAEPGDTYGDYYDTFYEKESLHENCFLANYVNTKLLPMAQQKGKERDERAFRTVDSMLQLVVWNRLFEQEVFTLTNRESGEIFISNNSLYILYTDMFKYMGKFDYQKLSGKEEVLRLAEEHDVQRIIVTDGPYGMIVVDKGIWYEGNV